MPLYDMRCKECNDKIEVITKAGDHNPELVCEKCGGQMVKVMEAQKHGHCIRMDFKRWSKVRGGA